ncbi:alpha-glucan family phosphorylase [Candidatus Contubernalis alkaliaceticus]|uniref:alpha-glucan family phosphorylase n=1 Tax=Candidatus Contubernalis alkaliaceticus TaxID=338645 RepID=UPI001F4C346A|nr:alpha-glucan family phosphorylase [Candidatus Contubernalis alkalaceticus]UNC92353.1 alpha-glucan family phosphorylase [Candidatus Contubernalis alkalaceticus]
MNNKENLPRVAYLCMEYGMHEELPIYSGGLGVLAGDVIKCAGEKKFPVVGIGILWRQGYTTQRICSNGKPYDVFEDIDLSLLKDTGIKVNVTVKNKEVVCKVWLLDRYGNAPLYLLDTYLPENEDNMNITHRLYLGSDDDRVAQEIVLGVGGIRALRALGISVELYHFNEGHAVLGAVEIIREKMKNGISFEEAWAETKNVVVFTTHTPVAAGNGSYNHETLFNMGAYNGLNYEQMSRIGGDPFSITVAGLRLSRRTNAVSKIHGETARKMWDHVKDASPIISITNGVHRSTWQDPRIKEAYDKDNDLWVPHLEAKRELVSEIYKTNNVLFNPEALTIGFARRVTAYKRCDLILGRPGEIEPLLANGTLQLVFSGKFHPYDEYGRCVIPRIIELSKKYPQGIVFLENYDIRLGKLLTRGCDVWLNTPRRPLEASGTSGMKAAMNGVLNMSILDGWWPEACMHGVNGWQIGHGYEGCNQDEHDLSCLYQVLMKEVIPVYYEDRTRWINMMKESIKSSIWNFSSERMITDYFSRLYAEGEVEVDDELPEIITEFSTCAQQR